MRDLGVAEGEIARNAVEHAVARALRRFREAVGPAMFRRLRQRHQQRRLAQGQPARLLAEIGVRGRPDAFEIAAIGREREVKPEDLILAERPFELDRAHHLPDLGIDRPLLPRLEQTGDLHGQRRAAGHDAAMGDKLVGGPHHGERIDAPVSEEALVLIGEQRLEIARVDLLARRRQPPAALAGEIGPERLHGRPWPLYGPILPQGAQLLAATRRGSTRAISRRARL